MGKVSLHKASDVKHNFIDGLSRAEILAGTSDEVKFHKCILKAGAKWAPPLYKYGEKVQWLFFMNPSGYVGTPEKAYNIVDKAIYIPDFDREEFFIQAGSDDLVLLHVEGKMNKLDVAMMNDCHIVLPRFRLLRDAWRYTEGFTGEAGSTIKSHMVIEHEYFGRYSMGWNCGKGPTFIGQHVHDDLEQWYFMLEGSKFTYLAGDEEFEVAEGDATHTEASTPHGSKSEAGQDIDYIWVELATNGYLPVTYQV